MKIAVRCGWMLLPMLGFVVLAGCSARTSDIKIDGSSTVYPISQAVAEEFGVEHSGVRITVGQTGTSGGMEQFCAGEIDICNASRPIDESEIKKCADKKIEYLELPVAYDGLSVVVNPANDWCDSLTVEQLKELWRPGSAINTWKDLDPEWPAEKIKLYGADADSGTFDYFTEEIVGKKRECRDDYMPSSNDNTLVTGVKEDKYSLGYFGLSYYEQNKDVLKLLGVDPGDGAAVQPTLETVRSGAYKPLSRPLLIYVNKRVLGTPAGVEFITYYLDNAQKLSEEVDYVPLTDEELAKAKETFQAALKK